MGIGEAIRSAAFLVEEGDELEPVTKSVCRRLEAAGVFLTGEEVRRLVRKSQMPVRKIDGRLMARESDIDRFVSAVRKKFEGQSV